MKGMAMAMAWNYIVTKQAVAVSETLGDLIFRLETLHAIQDVVRTYTSLQQERFTLYMEGYSFAEIARMQHCAMTTVRKSVTVVQKN